VRLTVSGIEWFHDYKYVTKLRHIALGLSFCLPRPIIGPKTLEIGLNQKQEALFGPKWSNGGASLHKVFWHASISFNLSVQAPTECSLNAGIE